jgi:hypothetical protein
VLNCTGREIQPLAVSLEDDGFADREGERVGIEVRGRVRVVELWIEGSAEFPETTKRVAR